MLFNWQTLILNTLYGLISIVQLAFVYLNSSSYFESDLIVHILNHHNFLTNNGIKIDIL